MAFFNGIGDLLSLKRITVCSVSQGLNLCFQGDEDRQIFSHGVAYVNMLPLLCPGVQRIRGAFRVCTYQDSEVLEKVRTGGTARLCAPSAALCAVWVQEYGQSGIRGPALRLHCPSGAGGEQHQLLGAVFSKAGDFWGCVSRLGGWGRLRISLHSLLCQQLSRES